MNYDTALQIIHDTIKPRLKHPDRNRVQRTATLLQLMNNPHHTLPIIHIAGTKGKGSVAAMCSSALQANGFKVGLYTSPYLQDFRERFQINRHLISKQGLIEIVQYIAPFLKQVDGPGFPETLTAIALHHFAQQSVDFAILEAHVGGLSDATNVIAPSVSVLTSISLDHMELLGSTLTAIATEKAGIIKSGIPVISAPQPVEAAQIIQQVAADKKAPLTMLGEDLQFTIHPPSRIGQEVTIHSPDDHDMTYSTSLIGQHQGINLAVTVAIMEQLSQQGILLTTEATQHGLSNVNWSGRFEIISENPLTILDCAHNPASIEQLRETIQSIFPEHRVMLVYGAKDSKDVQSCLQNILPIVDDLIITKIENPRALSLQDIEMAARQSDFAGSIHRIPELEEAISTAKELATNDALICITGSSYVVGEARTVLGLFPEID